MMTYQTMAEVRAANRRAGNHWFATDTLRFFGSRVSDTLYTGPGGTFFVSSERNPGWGETRGTWPRRYTVREARPDGTIGTVGEFQQYQTGAAAHRAARRAAAGEVTP